MGRLRVAFGFYSILVVALNSDEDHSCYGLDEMNNLAAVDYCILVNLDAAVDCTDEQECKQEAEGTDENEAEVRSHGHVPKVQH